MAYKSEFEMNLIGANEALRAHIDELRASIQHKDELLAIHWQARIETDKRLAIADRQIAEYERLIDKSEAA
ncbi:MAG: hypothetical protein AAF126_01970 [Chloroflexota bacterium]